MKKILSVLLSMIILSTTLLGAVPAMAAPNITSRACCSIDVASGQVLYSKNADTRTPTGSTAKLMTAYLVFEAMAKGQFNENTVVTISRSAASVAADSGLSNVPLGTGQKYTVKDLLNAMLVASACGATVALAETVSGSEAKFVSLMNSTLTRLGLSGNYVQCYGADSRNVITARSLAKLGCIVVTEHPEILKYTKQASMTFAGVRYNNTNSLLPGRGSAYAGVDGLKTGSSTAAGKCICVTAQKDGSRVVCVIMGADTYDTRNKEMTKLLDDAFYQIKTRSVSVSAVSSNAEWGTVTGAGKYLTGASVTLKATPKAGYNFLGWYDAAGNCVSTNASYTFKVTGAVSYTAKFGLQVTVDASRSGSAQGGGVFKPGDTVTVTAHSDSGAEFSAWYTKSGELLSNEAEYTFTAEKSLSLVAMFEGDAFYDVSEKNWYLEDAMKAYELGLIKGTTPIHFSGSETMTRAMVVTIIARFEGVDTSLYTDCPFEDVPSDSYYAGAVSWAYENGIVNGTSSVKFSPNATITREQMLTMLMRYLTVYKGMEISSAQLDYTDVGRISPYALEFVAQAQELGIVKGYENGSFGPQKKLTRAEGVTFIIRMIEAINNEMTEEIPQSFFAC